MRNWCFEVILGAFRVFEFGVFLSAWDGFRGTWALFGVLACWCDLVLSGFRVWVLIVFLMCLTFTSGWGFAGFGCNVGTWVDLPSGIRLGV